ncbi:hypothetical protein [Rhodopseudomonas sp. AAP120]|uniref:hypothetical protein n=1 Tax=Rhodopseudomonas sp. AAP120 TaxID=1523430 RepID=UPI0012E128A8|nr:hypothetical protein [Rhodopseudomonas sp. AAP120]
MNRLAILSIAIPLVLISIGFLLLGIVGYAMSPEWLSAQQIQDLARKTIAEPAYPPAPEGKQIVKSRPRQVCTNVPKISGLNISMQNSCVTINESVTTIEGPSTEETRNWQSNVANLRANYELAVNQEAARISERQRADLKTYIKDMIQISSGLLGLVTGIIGLFVGFSRGREGKQEGPSQ